MLRLFALLVIIFLEVTDELENLAGDKFDCCEISSIKFSFDLFNLVNMKNEHGFNFNIINIANRIFAQIQTSSGKSTKKLSFCFILMLLYKKHILVKKYVETNSKSRSQNRENLFNVLRRI